MNQESILPNKIPSEILEKKEYRDIILYAIGVFGPLGREEFINNSEKGITEKMNKNTFHKWAKFLKKNNWIEVIPDPRDSKKSLYNITPLGRDQLLKRLSKFTNLDFQTVNKIEQERIKTYINQIKKFFKEYDIGRPGIQVEFLKLSNEITYDKLNIFTENQFNKLILFLVLNHPKFYKIPNCGLSIQDFLLKYSNGDLSETDLKMFLQEVIEKDIYGLNFYKLTLINENYSLYFRSNEEFGKLFKITVDTRLKDMYYRKNLTETKITRGNIEDISNLILTTLIDRYKLFHIDLREPLNLMLKDYFNEIIEEITKRPTLSIPKYKEYTHYPLELFRNKPQPHYKIELFTVEDFVEIMELILIKNGEVIEINYIPKILHLMKKVNFSKALQEVDKLIKFVEENVAFLLLKAIILEMMKRSNDALKTINRVINLNPDLNQLLISYYLKSTILFEKKRYKDSLIEIENAINLKNIILKDKSLFLKTIISFNLERYSDALKTIEELIELEPDNISFFDFKIDILLIMEKYSLALDEINKRIKNNPNSSEYYQIKAQALENMENYNDALKEINKAIELDPKNSDYLLAKSGILLSMDDYDGTLNTINEAIELEPYDPDLFYHKAEFLSFYNKLEDAIESINKSIELDQKEYRYYCCKAEYLNELGRNDEALNTFEHTLEIIKNQPYCYYLKSRIQSSMSNYDLALDTINKAIEIAPKALIYYEEKANILSELERFDEALNVLEELKNLTNRKPEYEYYKNEINDLERSVIKKKEGYLKKK